jgi:hypothetical protein
MIIATTKSQNCLVALLASCPEPIRPLLYIETGHSDRLCIDHEAWATIPEENKKIILTLTDAFISGWEAREDWKDYE